MFRDILDALPVRGWGVVRAPTQWVMVLVSIDAIRAQYTPTPDVFQARLTGYGRRLRSDYGETND